ncbi:adenylate cyclase [Fibrobacter sp. UWB15]|nr:adenylate cyclase [Fibrobacter sp. UWB6]SHG54048.1 adenylate cyclase [Fibrobacter sp. UWB8]SMG41556.1 adenylate cyclase [Fibrobacter sp. UWB15]
MQIKFSKKIKKVLSGFSISALLVFFTLTFGSTQSSFLPDTLVQSAIGKTQRNGAEALENIFYDLFFKTSTHSQKAEDEEDSHQRVSINDSLDQNIFIVDIDEASLTKLGNYNEWDRSIHAKVIQNLSEGGAAAISFDILFKSADFGKQKTDQAANVLRKIAPEAEVDSLYPSLLANYNFDSMLVNAVKESGNTIVCYMFDERKSYKHASQWTPLSMQERADAIGYSSTLDTTQVDKIDDVEAKDLLDNIFPELANAGVKAGSVNAYPDNDGVVRKVSMLYRFPNPDLDIIPFLDTTLASDKEKYDAVMNSDGKSHVYSTMSLMTILHLFHKDPKDITVKMGKYIDIGKPFGIYRDSTGIYHTTYPNFSYHMFLLLRETLAEKKIHNKASEDALEISHKVFASKDENGKISLELSNGGTSSVLDEQESNLLMKVTLEQLDALEEEETVKLTRDYIIRKDEDEDGFYQIVRNSTDDEEDEDEDESIDFTRCAIKTLIFYKDTLKRMPAGNKMILSLDMQLRYNKATKKWSSNMAILSDAVIRDIQATKNEVIENLKPGEELRFGKVKRIPIDQNGRYQVKYKGRYNEINNRRFQHLSYYDVYRGRIDNLFYQGKIFILGSAAAALFDFVPGPQEENYPAVLIHSTIIKNILEDDYLVTLSEKKQQIIVVILALLCLILGLYFTSSISVVLSLILMGIYTYIAYKYFQGGLYIGVSKQLLAMLLTSITALVVQFYFENKEKNFINNAFKQYISPELITAMVDNEIMPTLGGEKSNLTAYFTDIASFSTFSEKIGDPKKLVDLLNEYLTAMTDTLLENKGTLDKYEGDAIIAFFGAPMPLPNNAQYACETAVGMQEKLMKLRRIWASELEIRNNQKVSKWPKVVHNMHMRIGINTGDIVTGNMGSSMRKNYTMMGDAVNLAARLESAAKQYGAYIQISEDTQRNLETGTFIYRSLDTIRVVGKSQPIKTFELLAITGLGLTKLNDEAQTSLFKKENFKNETIEAKNKFIIKKRKKARRARAQQKEDELNRIVNTRLDEEISRIKNETHMNVKADVKKILREDITQKAKKELDKKYKLNAPREVYTSGEIAYFAKKRNSQNQNLIKLVELWERARACYLNMQWDDAIELFKQCLDLEPHHPDRDPGSKTTPSHVYIQRCEAYKITPPVAEGEVWDGVFTATEK